MKADIKQWNFINQLLRSILLDVEHHFGVEFRITSTYRIDDGGVHGTLPLRGIDLGCPDEALGTIVAKYTNSKYQYDPDRVHKNVCMWHGKPKHLHFQVHPNTIVINQ